jgi:hypothetical protein
MWSFDLGIDGQAEAATSWIYWALRYYFEGAGAVSGEHQTVFNSCTMPIVRFVLLMADLMIIVHKTLEILQYSYTT